ncbi:hypothetical protein V6N13_098288 [Hibiscus sabdariffa]|uniref:Uncharacterized protein n=1 Tax=Hibiscus sabdariffa TaxID=183260 RepID=A0ABR2EFK7_9ROSI
MDWKQRTRNRDGDRLQYTCFGHQTDGGAAKKRGKEDKVEIESPVWHYKTTNDLLISYLSQFGAGLLLLLLVKQASGTLVQSIGGVE